MEPFIKHTGVVAALDRANIDTDAIIPKQFLKKIERRGFGVHLFHEWRYTDYLGTKENPEFLLNQPLYRKATILLTRDNLGCGSSREHAPWAIADFGFRAMIAPSFADIFYHNSINNGLLPVILSPAQVQELFLLSQKEPGVKLTIDLNKQIVILPDKRSFEFQISAFAKHCLLNGLDQIGWTLQHKTAIKEFENQLKAEKPWLA